VPAATFWNRGHNYFLYSHPMTIPQFMSERLLHQDAARRTERQRKGLRSGPPLRGRSGDGIRVGLDSGRLSGEFHGVWLEPRK
jgi:hypothetical protein